MRINTTKEDLIAAIQVVIGAVGTKNTLPILSHILIEAENQTVRLTTTDLDIGITYLYPASVLETGHTTVPAKRFLDIIKELPQAEVKISTKKNNTMQIESKNTLFKILTVPPEEFPKPPKTTNKENIKIQQKTLKEMLLKTTFAMSKEETRYVLNGVLMETNTTTIQLIATDGRRLAIIQKPNNKELKEQKRVIIPAKTTQELQKTLTEEGEVEIIFDKKQVIFNTHNTSIISRLIEGDFPDYRQAIPQKTNNKLTINRENFIAAIKRASLLTTPESQAITLRLTHNKLTITKTTPEIGEATEEIESQYTGPELQIGFNPTYLQEALKTLQGLDVSIELTGSDKPGVVRVNNEEYIYIVLPMQIV
jgi:DNA polymerase III subunit beta